ncbi:chromatin-remodeling ATPase INO80-like [Beta vulgaris subsp. vulgaris]|uniref:chromatin-remodeling ATPase INO80-like n=1 Tax=Beta vulgaris subsp. vulgaris TaxID=3555 RepID=UPI0025473829|nr:chromatin-remodeling ATPase INO80-like [Beta vulgaris subsp. vulgaris]
MMIDIGCFNAPPHLRICSSNNRETTVVPRRPTQTTHLLFVRRNDHHHPSPKMSSTRERGCISQKDGNKGKGKRQLLDTEAPPEKNYSGRLGKKNDRTRKGVTMSARARAVKAREEVLAPTSKNDREKTHMEDFTIPNYVDNDSDDNISEEEDMLFSDILFQREREDDEDRVDDNGDDTDDVEGDDIGEEDEEEQNVHKTDDWQLIRGIDGGPSNPDLLTGFRAHVAHYIWIGRDRGLLTCTIEVTSYLRGL